ncbi:hypothetical protein BDV93DRAFT_67319 [Ceratobasidium sp. AG-I]|nr:hypothetical protein BDV93DRAFT_67319 [Ceratobasidium sp. AG-I]
MPRLFRHRSALALALRTPYGRFSTAAAEPVIAPFLTLGERLGLLGERPGSSVVGEHPSRRQELVRTASFGELPHRKSGLLGGVGKERRSGLLSKGHAAITRGASYNGPNSSVPFPLARSSSLNTTTECPNSAFRSLLGLGPASSLPGLGLNMFDRANAGQPHTRTHTPIPRAPGPSPKHTGMPIRQNIAPHPATVLAPSAGFGTLFGSNALDTSFGSAAPGTNGPYSSLNMNGGSGSGVNTPSYSLLRSLPPPGGEYSGTGLRVASPLPPHLSSELVPPGGSVPESPLATAFGGDIF